jgi:hypothetical protein
MLISGVYNLDLYTFIHPIQFGGLKRKMEQNKIYLGDCLKVMKGLAFQSGITNSV